MFLNQNDIAYIEVMVRRRKTIKEHLKDLFSFGISEMLDEVGPYGKYYLVESHDLQYRLIKVKKESFHEILSFTLDQSLKEILETQRKIRYGNLVMNLLWRTFKEA